MRAESLILAMDIGSSSVRSALFTENGTRVLPSTASRKYSITYSADGGAELDATVLLRAAKSCIAETMLSRRRVTARRRGPIVAIAGSAFWHGLLILNRMGKPISPVYTWADARGASDAATLRDRLNERVIQQRTGCMVRAPFWPAKLLWIRRSRPSLFKCALRFTSPAGWIFRELFGTDVTSHSMASGTGLYHLAKAAWDPELCRICGIRFEQLDTLGDLARARQPLDSELRDLPVFGALGDGAASNLGSGANRRSRVAINIGTSAAVRTVCTKGEAGHRVPFGLFKYVVDEDRVVLGGAISNAGNLRDRLLQQLRLSEKDADKALSRTQAATDTLTILPYLVSERSPTWPEDLRGVISGLTPTTTAADLFRASITSSFYRLADIVDALPGRARQIIVSGGVLHSPPSVHILSDCLGRDLQVSGELESSLRGAAIRALASLGFKMKPLPAGRTVRHNPTLAKKHLLRRARQVALERRLR